MATVGLDRLYYSKITEDTAGDETYGTPQLLAKAISADLEIELNEATLFADDSAAEVVKEFKRHRRGGRGRPGRRGDRRQRCGDFAGRRNAVAGRGRFPGEEEQRQVPIFLGLSRDLWHPGNEPCHEGRQHQLQYADGRRHDLPAQ